MNRNIRIIIQVRLDSSRLPGKAMLWTPIGPLFVAVALRAKFRNNSVVVATSEDKDGDLLSKIASNYSIPIYQGSKVDVLDRFVGATKDLDGDAKIVRLTADNLLPDGKLINFLLSNYEKYNVDYISTNTDGIPYGLSVEIFNKSVLDSTNAAAYKPEDREHVTSWIIRNEKYQKKYIFPPEINNSLTNLRVTIDTLEDYSNWLAVFNSGADILDTSWFDLLKTFSKYLRG